MSRYLIDRVEATRNIELRARTTATKVFGTPQGALENVTLACRQPQSTWRVDAQHLFLFPGADPHTLWLDRRIVLDNKGFVLTGADAAGGRRSLETSRRGVFAIGDIRSGSTKRVAAAVGEGAQVVATLHAYFAAREEQAMAEHGRA